MKRSKTLRSGMLILAALLTACAPVVTVENKTTFPVRAIVSMPGGIRQVLSPSPGYSSSAEGTESTGAYRVTVIADSEWIEYARLKRKVLNDALANSDQLSGPQLLEVIRQLKEVAEAMQRFEQAAGGGASCGGRLTEKVSMGLAEVVQTPDGQLVVTCK